VHLFCVHISSHCSRVIMAYYGSQLVIHDVQRSHRMGAFINVCEKNFSNNVTVHFNFFGLS
jgi:hypothetical protein